MHARHAHMHSNTHRFTHAPTGQHWVVALYCILTRNDYFHKDNGQVHAMTVLITKIAIDYNILHYHSHAASSCDV